MARREMSVLALPAGGRAEDDGGIPSCSDPPMPWLLLGTAGLLEIVFAFAMKSSEGFTRWLPALVTVATGVASVVLLATALKTIPVGTGYAVWTGIGAAGTAIVGIVALGDSPAPLRIACIILILLGVIGLRLAPG